MVLGTWIKADHVEKLSIDCHTGYNKDNVMLIIPTNKMHKI